MIFEPITGDLKSDDPKDVAKLIHSFFQSQYENSIVNDIRAQAEYNGALSANMTAEREYNNDPDINWGGGFSSKVVPYDARHINLLQTAARQATTQRHEARILLDFIVGRIIDNVK